MKKIIAMLVTLMLLINMDSYAYAVKKDTTAPVVAKTNPQNNGTNIMIESSIMIRFNETIKKGKTTSKITLMNTNKYSLDYSYTITDNLLVITPKKNLQYNMKYTVTVPEAAVCDSTGNGLKEKYTLCFTTEEKSWVQADLFDWKTSSFSILPEPKAVLTGFVQDQDTDSIMCTFTDMNKADAVNYISVLKESGYSGIYEYSGDDGVMYIASTQTGYVVDFTYCSKTSEGTILYRYDELKDEEANSEQEVTDNSDDANDDSGAGEGIDATADTDITTDTDTAEIYNAPTITLSSVRVVTRYPNSVKLVATLSGDGVLTRWTDDETKFTYHVAATEAYPEMDCELSYENSRPDKFELYLDDYTNNTLTFYIIPKSDEYTDITLTLLPIGLGDVDVETCRIECYY